MLPGPRAVGLALFVLTLPWAAHASVFLVGMDGAEWKVIDPMLARGELPNFAKLIARGRTADLETVEPVISPTVWTSIATGRSPAAHGITDFYADAQRLKTPTMFERLAARGRRVGLYDYLVTWPPAELPRGFVIPGWLRRDTSVTPTDVWSHISLSPFAVDYATPKTNLDYLELSRAEIAQKAARWNALAGAFDLEVGAVSFYTPDSRSHRFWRAAFPDQFEDPGPEVSAELEAAIHDGYRGMDRALGEIVGALGPEDVLMVASDHGFEASEGPRPVWVGRMRSHLAQAGLDPEQDGIAIVTQFGALAISVTRADETRSFADRDAVHTRVYEFLASMRDAEGEALYNAYSVDIAERPEGFERSLFARIYQWILGKVLIWVFGVEIDTRPHGIVFALPDSDVLEAAWPDAQVQVLGGEHPITEVVERQEFTGSHNPIAVFIAAGGPIAHADERGRLSVLDIAPLVFHLSGELVPEDLEGHVPEAWLDPAWVAAHPVRRAEIGSFPELPSGPVADPRDAGERHDVEERLRGLGYVE